MPSGEGKAMKFVGAIVLGLVAAGTARANVPPQTVTTRVTGHKPGACDAK